MKKYRILLVTLCALAFVSDLRGQSQPPLNPDEERRILEALITRDELAVKVRELESQNKASEAQLQIQQDRILEERAQLLKEKERHLAALHALMAYRTTRRPRIVKILTFGIVGDKRDPLLLAQIEELQEEIRTWK